MLSNPCVKEDKTKLSHFKISFYHLSYLSDLVVNRIDLFPFWHFLAAGGNNCYCPYREVAFSLEEITTCKNAFQ